jgi:regulator of sigma E protease
VSAELTEVSVESRSRPIWEAVGESFISTWELLVLLKQSIGGMISAGAAPELSGPIGIAQMTGEVSRDGGLSGWLSVGILLSINLAIINILPFPMLDGGRIVFVVIEWIRRGKRIPPEKEGMVHLVGLAVLIAGIIAISANDILRLLEGGSLLGG